jgi:hypothetical protein
MTDKDPDPKLTSTLLALQQAEITEHHIYKKIAAIQKIAHNREILDQIAHLNTMISGKSTQTGRWHPMRSVSGFITLWHASWE